MKEHKINKLDNFIKGWYIENKICDDLIKFFNKNKKHQVSGRVAGGVIPEIKKSTDLNFSMHLEDKTIIGYANALSKCMEKYRESYKTLDSHLDSWNIIEGVNIQRYKKNEGYFGWHAERTAMPLCKRLLVFMTYLNDVTEGGETEWFYQKTKIKPEKGLTVIWPAEWTHLHKGCVSKTQEKYIITGWYSFV
jgi:prolyl 4-hydroxylase